MGKENSGHWRPGQTGNAKGRPRKPRESESVFQVIKEQQFTVVQNGVERQMTAEEVLQWKTYQAAIGGSLPDIKVIQKMIETRMDWFAANQDGGKQEPKVSVKYERDPTNHYEAMMLLGIASRREPEPRSAFAHFSSDFTPEDPDRLIQLEPWVHRVKRPRPGPKAT